MLSGLRTIATIGLVFAASPGHSAVPFFNATCPGDIEVHADQGGPIYVNGKEAKLKVFNANSYEATHDHVTISLTINPDGTPDVLYTARGGANGVCTIKSD
jgi:hypothetical protein